MEYIEIGINKYERGIFLDGYVIEVFRTDSLKDKQIVINEAERRLEYLKKEYPDRNYKTADIPEGMRVRKATILH